MNDGVAPTSIRQSAKKAVTFKDQLPSSTNKRRLHSPASSEVADSEDDYNTDEDDNEDVANAVAGIDIGQETQAYIRRIDFNCASAPPTAEPDPGEESTQDEDGSPPQPDSTANRSFNYDEEAHQRLQQTQAEHPSPAPATPQEAPPSPAHASPSSPIPMIKREPETQQQPQLLQLWDSSTQGQHQQPPPLSCPVPPSQATTTDSPTQTSPGPFVKPDPAEAPPSSQPPQSSYLPETYYSNISADERIPSSQPTQLHLKQILLQPQTQTQDEEDGDGDEQDRVPDSQGVGRREVESVEKGVAGARVVRRVEGLVTATQMMMQQGSMGDEFSLPPPPPWSQTQETEDEE
ncbi:uncharacterized protein LTHEOB_8662 [Lasiodiplodia theobromae]|uniref:Uncharacterized protein n=1 Tax=Lasiodiplodia theobromae TaxID=45133 RepID=A0A5N5D7V8_9PEZI|nr:uncharacterized protein LTHEOB_8662 [Lasiodiplodia theobromae]KAB2573883.1 hypothetical protein DBV05_g7452 [Lasiodiplodia theobromae]KAF4541266.1 hypothetical protein LTHEOB_8662 [Lasiodiplodia theobromae]